MYNFSKYVSKLILCVNGLLTVQCVSMLQPLFLHRNSVDKILKIVVGPIPRMLQKVRQDRATVPLIAPWWPKRTWFLVMITLVVGYPRTLPVRRDVISQPIPGTLHPRPSALHLTAWPLSGRPELRQAFSERLRPLLPAADGILPERRTFPSCRIFQLVRISGGGSPFGTSDGRGRFLSSLFDKGRLVF